MPTKEKEKKREREKEKREKEKGKSSKQLKTCLKEINGNYLKLRQATKIRLSFLDCQQA